MEINTHLESLSNRILELEVQQRMEQRRNDALQLVVSWLLAKHPDNEAMFFLSCQANALEGNPKYVDDVMLLDDLREDVAQWRAQWSSDPSNLS